MGSLPIDLLREVGRQVGEQQARNSTDTSFQTFVATFRPPRYANTLTHEVVEDGDTLEANALKKAREVRDFTGLCALADDTGLEVDRKITRLNSRHE